MGTISTILSLGCISPEVLIRAGKNRNLKDEKQQRTIENEDSK